MHISASQCWAQAPEEAPACAQTQGLRPEQSCLPGFASPVQFAQAQAQSLLSFQGRQEPVALATAQLHCWQSMCVLTGQKVLRVRTRNGGKPQPRES